MIFSSAFLKNIQEVGINGDFYFDEPMKNHTSFKTGGKADLLFIPKNEQSVSDMINLAKWEKTAVTVIGNGTNLLVSDEGIRGIVIKTSGGLCEMKVEGDIIKAQSGVSLTKLCNTALEHSLSGLEFAFGIPATVGGAIYMNAGAYSGEIKDVLACSWHLDEQQNAGKYLNNELNFSYRHSKYTGSKFFITQGDFKLKKGEKDEIKALMNDLLGKRKSKQPLEFPSAGSTFKRPEGYFAAALIEECGLKGKSIGGAQVSEKHSGFIINTGNATTLDILELIDFVKQTVKSEKGVELETEVRIL